MGTLHPLAWENVVFYAPLTLGVLLVAASATGLSPADVEGDVDGDLDGDIGGDGAWARLGVGAVPLTLLVTVASLLAGALGVVANAAQQALTGEVSLALSSALALAGSAVFTGRIARAIRRMLPSAETYTVRRSDLVGRAGSLVVATDEGYGVAQVTDPEGNVHTVECRASRGAMPAGEAVRVIDYDPASGRYTVVRGSDLAG
ncbi:MAG: DUF1449 family protein [Polyangiales bacterium]